MTLVWRPLSWQHTPGPALLGWVGYDAEFIAGEILFFLSVNVQPRPLISGP